MEENTSPRPTPQQMSLQQQVHLTDYLNIIKRRKWVVIGFFLAVITIVAVVSFQATRIYKATAQIIIEQQISPLTPIANVAVNDTKQQDYYQTQYNLLRSRSLACKVIKDLELWKDFEVNMAENPNPSTSKAELLIGVGEKWNGGIPVATTETSGSQINPLIVNWYLSSLQITPIRGSRLVNVSFLGSSPELISRIVNAHVVAFIEEKIQMQRSAAEKALEWIKVQLTEQKTKVEQSQRAIHEYKRKNNLISTKARADRMIKQATYKQLEDFPVYDESIFTLPEVNGDQVIQNLRSQLVQLKTQRLEMATKYGPKHPRMLELESRVRQLEQEVMREVHQVKRAIKTELDRSKAIEDSVQRALDSQKQAAMSLSERAIDHNVLKRQAESHQDIYDLLLKDAKETSLTSVMESTNVRIVDKAEIPLFPVKPRIFLNILLAVVLGLFMGTGLAFFIEYMDNTIKTPNEIPQRLGMPVLGVLPYDKSLKKRKTPALPWSIHPAANDEAPVAYPLHNISNCLPASCHFMDQSISDQVLLVESATMGEGKTTVLGNLAMNLVNAGLRVLMVDCDLQRPNLHNLFGIKNEGGLAKAMADILSHKMDAGKLHRHSLDDLFFLITFKKQSGDLIVTNNSQITTATFQDGHLLHIQNEMDTSTSHLGTLLLRGGFITESQLDEALNIHRRTGQPLGYILINAGYITQEKLKGPLRLQMEEHLQRLFSWKQGSFVFRPGRVETYEHERIYFGEDYTPIIQRLGRQTGSRLVESVILSQVKSCFNGNLYILPAGTASGKAIGALNFTLLAKFLDILKQRFDVILVDTAPLLGGPGVAPLDADKIMGAILNQAKVSREYSYYHYHK
jgi:uncharacterized protein involved in exopolysaccharide biosynthesis/Mrp family chromosome partitioning ATPase